MKIKWHFAGIISLLSLTLLNACSLVNDGTVVPLVDQPTATLTITPTPKPIATPLLGPIPMPKQFTIPTEGPFPEVVKEDYPSEAIISWLITAKVQGVDPQVVATELKSAGWISDDVSWNPGAAEANDTPNVFEHVSCLRPGIHFWPDQFPPHLDCPKKSLKPLP